MARYPPLGGQAPREIEISRREIEISQREIEIAIWTAELPLEIAELPRRDPVAEDTNHLLGVCKVVRGG